MQYIEIYNFIDIFQNTMYYTNIYFDALWWRGLC